MTLVVIGGIAAGLSAAARARRLDAGLEIIVLERGDLVSLGACGLPYYVEGRVREARQLVQYDAEYLRRERRIDVRTGARVVAVSHGRREVALENGQRVRYDKLIIATGARPAAADLAGAGAPHVFTLHSLDDAERLKTWLREKTPRRAAVVGAGYIGLEAADALRRHGLEVTIHERAAGVLGRDDAELTAAVARHLEAHGVELRCGARVASIDELAADVVVLAAGVRPNVELAAEAGVETGRTGAIRTDECMETNLRGVFAAGDCAETTHIVTGRPVYIPLGTTANKMGRVAGANAAGRRERFAGVAGTSIVGVFGLAIATTGLSVAQARAEGFSPVFARIDALARPVYFQGRKTTVELVADRASGRLLGGTVIGEQDAAGRIGIVATALAARMRVEDLQQLDLAYAPPFAPVWDPLLVAAQQLVKQL
jgi:NADPH-dependent 2,4-dienoyl-CoA reductase/sulfur reductase-like enzyme